MSFGAFYIFYWNITGTFFSMFLSVFALILNLNALIVLRYHPKEDQVLLNLGQAHRWWSVHGYQRPGGITIPNSVISIGEWAFDVCRSLTDVYSYSKVSNGTYPFYLHGGSLPSRRELVSLFRADCGGGTWNGFAWWRERWRWGQHLYHCHDFIHFFFLTGW